MKLRTLLYTILEKDAWKNDFLMEITDRYGMIGILNNENKDYILIGLPFFNVEENTSFEKGMKRFTA